MFNNLKKISTVIFALLIIAGCGFHLRGTFNFPEHLKTLYIVSDDSYSQLQRTLRRCLANNNIQIANAPDKDIATLEVTEPTFAESVLSTNIHGQPQVFRLVINFQYKVTYKQKTLRPFTQIQSSRDLNLNPNQILSNENEKHMIKEELLKEGVNQLLRQLSTIQSSNI